MGFIQAFVGAIGGSFADQWKDFYTVPYQLSATAGIVPAVQQSQNAGRGSNVKGSANIITNGSTIVIPEGFGLLTFENGALTGFVAQPGGYIFTSTDINAQSFFSGGGLIDSVIKQSWERFKYGGQPGSQQAAFYVNLKEIPGLKFGTKSEIYWYDGYLQTQAGALARGSYTLKIVDPILFVRQFVPAEYISAGHGAAFDFSDFGNAAAAQLFDEVVGSLQSAFAQYSSDPSHGHSMSRIQGDSAGFAMTLGAAVEQVFNWKSLRGLEIVQAVLMAIEYDEGTRALLTDVQRADALMGNRGNSFLQQSVARGMQAAGSNEGSGGGALGMGFMGMGMNAAGGMAGGLQQPSGAQSVGAQQMGVAPGVSPAAAPAAGMPVSGVPGAPAVPGAPGAAPAPGVSAPVPVAPVGEAAGAAVAPAAPATPAAPAAPAAADPYEELTKLKGLLDNGIITQEDFDKKKSQLLGL